MPQRVVEVEVLQCVWTDKGFGALRRLAFFGRDEFGRNFGSEDRIQCRTDIGRELVRTDHPTDQVLDQRLWDAGVDIVMRNLVADAISTPAECQLGQVPSPDDNAVMVVGEAEQVVGTQTRLYILKRQIIYRLALCKRVTDVT